MGFVFFNGKLIRKKNLSENLLKSIRKIEIKANKFIFC